MLFLKGKKKKLWDRATTDLTSKRRNGHKNVGEQIVLESTRNGICNVGENSLSEDTLRIVWDFILSLALYLSI